MKVEIRADNVILDGYVNVPGRDSRVLNSIRGKFTEQIQPKAFERALEKVENVDIFMNHDKTRKLGSTAEKTAQLYEDSIGLRCILETADPVVRERAEKKELRGWSFGFIATKEHWEEGEVARRYVEELDLTEVSLLDITPAYVATSVELRSEQMEEHRAEDAVITTTETETKTTREDADGLWTTQRAIKEIEIYQYKRKGE